MTDEATIEEFEQPEGELADFVDAFRPVALALGLGLVAFAALFWSEGRAAVGIWEASTAYNHCFFVIPIALYLAWDRRNEVVGKIAQPMPKAAWLMVPLALAWLLVERLGIMEGRQLIVITMVEVLFLTCLGWQLWWTLSAGLLYLYFLVPFGYFLTPWLQTVTAHFTDVGLTVLGISHYTDDLIIEISAGRFLIAEACAGLRFLIASVAFGVLYACLIYRSPGRRAVFFIASLIIPVVANGFRALGIVTLGHILGSAEAAAADHLIYGWIFNSFVILLLILAGLPFREDQQERVASPNYSPPQSFSRWSPIAAVVLVGIAASSGPALALWFDRAGGGDNVAMIAPQFAIPQGCVLQPASTTPTSARSVQDYICGPVRLQVAVEVFSSRASPGILAVNRDRLSGAEASDERLFSTMTIPGIEPSRWRTVTTETPPRVTAMTYWLDGRPSAGGLKERLLQARNSILGSRYAQVLMAVSAEPIIPAGQKIQPMTGPERQVAERAIQVFLNAQSGLAGQVAALAVGAIVGRVQGS
jgi:exosortase A